MSKALREKIDELFEATKDLKSLDEIKPHCEIFNEWLNYKHQLQHRVFRDGTKSLWLLQKVQDHPLRAR